MRMRRLGPNCLCRQHLLGEHGELHSHRHVFVRGYRIAGRRGQIDPLRMKIRHDALAAEMIRRGYKHNSPYTLPDLSAYGDLSDWTLDKADTAALLLRCPDCRKRTLVAGTHNIYTV